MASNNSEESNNDPDRPWEIFGKDIAHALPVMVLFKGAIHFDTQRGGEGLAC